MAFVTNPMNFPNLTSKATPIGADILMIADSAASNAIKQILISSLPFVPSAGALIADVNAASQAMAIDTFYMVRYSGGVCTLTLPAAASAPFGSYIGIWGVGAISNPYVIAQNANQFIQAGDQTTTVGVGGTLTAANKFNVIILRNIDQGGTGLTWAIQSTYGGSFNGV